jgi:hypothetical protein
MARFPVLIALFSADKLGDEYEIKNNSRGSRNSSACFLLFERRMRALQHIGNSRQLSLTRPFETLTVALSNAFPISEIRGVIRAIKEILWPFETIERERSF